MSVQFIQNVIKYIIGNLDVKLPLNKFNSNSVNTLFRDSIYKMITFHEHQSTISKLFCYLKKIQRFFVYARDFSRVSERRKMQNKIRKKAIKQTKRTKQNILLPHATHQSDKTIVLEWEGKANVNKTEDQGLNKRILPTLCLQKSNNSSIVFLGSV